MLSVRRTLLSNFDLHDPRFDQFIFIRLLLIGALLILLLRAFDTSALPVIAVAVVSMSLYVIVALYLKSYQSQPDRTADNCCYMGIVFAVVSLTCLWDQYEIHQYLSQKKDIEKDTKLIEFSTVINAALSVCDLFVDCMFEKERIETSYKIYEIRSGIHDTRFLIASTISMIQSLARNFSVAVAIIIGSMIARLLFNQWRAGPIELE